MIIENSADEKLKAVILKKFREEKSGSWVEKNHPISAHMGQCDSLRVLKLDASDGEYGCETGCEYARFEADLECDHMGPCNYEYGEFGELAYIIEEMMRA